MTRGAWIRWATAPLLATLPWSATVLAPRERWLALAAWVVALALAAAPGRAAVGLLALLLATQAGLALGPACAGGLLGAALVLVVRGGVGPPTLRGLTALGAGVLAGVAERYLGLLALAALVAHLAAAAPAVRARVAGWREAWAAPPTLTLLLPACLLLHAALLPVHGALARRLEPPDGCALCHAGVPWAPAQDAVMWLQLGEVLAERGELPHRRPAYALLAGAVRAWTSRGEPYAMALTAVNLLLQGLAVALLAALLGRVCGRLSWVVVVVPLVLVSGQVALHSMSEPLGFVLLVGAVAAWELVPRGSRPLAWAALGGVLFGLSNVTRTFTLPAAPLALAGVSLAAPRGRRWAALLAAGLGLSAAVGPVVLANWQRFGVATVTLNSADMVWAATEPRFGVWSPAAEAAMESGQPESARARNERLLAEARRNLRAHPGLYARRALARALQAFPPYFRLEWGLLALLLPFALRGPRPRERALGCGLVGLGVGAAEGSLPEALAGAGLLALGWRELRALPVAPTGRLLLLLGGGALAGAVALSFLEARALLQVEWVFGALLALGLVGAPRGAPGAAPEPTRRAVRWLLATAVVLGGATWWSWSRVVPAPPFRPLASSAWQRLVPELPARGLAEWAGARELPYALGRESPLTPGARVYAATELTWPLVTYPPGAPVVDLGIRAPEGGAYLTLAGHPPVLVRAAAAPTAWSGRRVLVLGWLRAGAAGAWVEARAVVPLDPGERPLWDQALRGGE